MKKITRRSRRLTAGFMATLLLVGAVSAVFSPRSFADFNHDAHGVINACALSGSITVISGWAHDPDTAGGNSSNPTVTVTVGTQNATVKTSVANYHDAAINSYLSAHWPNAPTGSVYGFTATFSGLYKGTAYLASGSANNIGSGANTALKVDTTATSADGLKLANLFNANNTLPDACLNTRPVTPSPPPTPTPTPTPSPTPSPGSTGGSSNSGNKSSGTSATSNGLSAAADGSVAAGTLNAVATIPADGASSVYITYGMSPDNLDSSTDSADTTTGNATVNISNLIPKTDYFYQIIRSDTAGNTSTSSPVGFKTSGYTVTVHYIDKNGKAVSGIAGAIDDADKSSGKSDKNGNLTFSNLDSGQYTVTYHYGKLNYKQSFDTDSAGDGSDDPGKTITLKNTVNVSKLSASSGSTAGYTGKKSSGPWGIILFILFVIILVVGFILWRRRRRNAALYGAYSPSASYAAMTPDVIDKPTPLVAAVPVPKKKKSDPAPEQLEHVGESLRDMVIQSMHEEAQKRKTNRQ